MTPELRSRMRKTVPRVILVGLLAVFGLVCWKAIYDDWYVLSSPSLPVATPVEPVNEWLYVQANNVLLWPVVKGKCTNRSALAQVHIGEKVLVIMRQGEWVEVELNNQSREHSHGCIHETLLGKDNGKG